jgi:NADH-quinone oxidoreductase subunit N
MFATLLAQAPGLATPRVDWVGLLPLLILMGGGVLLLTVVSLLRRSAPAWLPTVWTVVVSLAALGSVIVLWKRVGDAARGPKALVDGAVSLDGFGLFVIGVLCIGVLLSALVADVYLRREDIAGVELFVLLMLSASGGGVMAVSNDLIVTFIGLEILSIAAYVLCALHVRRASSQEAGMKYFVLGAFASAFLLYGMAMVYGATGSTNLGEIQTFLSTSVLVENGRLLLGIGLMLVGFGFKVAAVPFHSWSPDVYQGAPTPVTGFMASVVKAAGFAGLIRVVVVGFESQWLQWRPAIYALAAMSLVIGAVAAITQRNVKRMLAYSSINHAGFMLLGVQAGLVGVAPALFYLGVYTFMVIGSFAVVSLVSRRGDGATALADFAGLSRRKPALALAFTVFLLAQAGTPFTAGFLAKFGVLKAAAQTGNWSLAIIGMLSAVISAYIYLRIVVSMYFAGDEDDLPTPAGARLRIPALTGLAIVLCLAGTLVPGFAPQPFEHLAQRATVFIGSPDAPPVPAVPGAASGTGN